MAPDSHAGKHGILIAPRVKPVAANPDSNVEVKPDRHPAHGRHGPAPFELLVRYPLRELEEAELHFLVTSQLIECFSICSAPFVGPFPPWAGELSAKKLETGKSSYRKRVVCSKELESLASFRRGRLEKRGMRNLQRAHLGFGYDSVIDRAGVPKSGQRLVDTDSCDTGKFRYGFHIDIDRVDEQPAVGIIR